MKLKKILSIFAATLLTCSLLCACSQGNFESAGSAADSTAAETTTAETTAAETTTAEATTAEATTAEITAAEAATAETTAAAASTATVDVDLTSLSSTMVYSEVYNMMISPEDYIGKIVKMCGSFAIYEDESTGKIYYACVIADATACCSQGIEFVLEGDYSYPADYPELGDEITVTGEFETYEEGGITYCQLSGAAMEA